MVRRLLSDIRQGVDASFELLVTLNIPEDESFLEGFRDLAPIVIRNATPKGFGANHNAAFARSRGQFFAVVNPDIRAHPFAVRPLLDVLADPGVGTVGPAVLAPNGELEDSARRFPTAWRLIRRRLGGKEALDYDLRRGRQEVDWLAGMFLVFRREIFARLGGFDERYFMYLEDTDICRRLGGLGLRTVIEPQAQVVHDARRASGKSLRHFAWHVRSAWRFLTTGS